MILIAQFFFCILIPIIPRFFEKVKHYVILIILLILLLIIKFKTMLIKLMQTYIILFKALEIYLFNTIC